MSDFEDLIRNVEHVHSLTSSHAKTAVNQMLTVRNWAIGYYIVEFEQHGQNRAAYGERLLPNLAERLNIKGLDRLQLNLCRIFYLKYPQICAAVSHKLKSIEGTHALIALPAMIEKVPSEICYTLSNKFQTPPEQLINKLSFSHIREIMTIDNQLERFFYEIESMRCNWSVRELKRQIATNLYFRAGISKNPEKLLAHTAGKKQEQLSIQDPFTFEFLGIDADKTVSESDLEQALMDHLQEFLLEMGRGFCFEARQKRITIDDEYYFIDLVLYNRILHCNVIIELKNDKFSHEHLGQLNAYVSHYKENEMSEGDNPPIGILLCTKKGKKMVEYALADMDNKLFVPHIY